MNSLLQLAYGAAGGLATWLSRVAPDGDGKVIRSLAARRGLIERFEAWGARARDRSRPLLWMHAPSVGEGLQARPVLELLRERRPGLQLLYTFFSPSAERFARQLAVDYTDYLPFDTTSNARRVIDAVAPSAIVFSKLDLWPSLSGEAAARAVPLGLVSGTVSQSSSRRGVVARALLTSSYARLDAAGAVSTEDAEQLVSLGVQRSAVRVTGDTRYDQVWSRARLADPTRGLLRDLASERPTLVAGSTWPSDEAVLFTAWSEIRRLAPSARLLIAPHEPTERHLAPIERWASESGLRLARINSPDAGDAGDADVILVDRVGVLGDLYALATAAFVGGGFHAAGLHSVLEPAAFGVPVAFGPRHSNSRDAGLLLAAGGAREVSDGGTGGPAHGPTGRTAASVIGRWLADHEAAATAGACARFLVQQGLGAAERSYALVEELLGKREEGRGKRS